MEGAREAVEQVAVAAQHLYGAAGDREVGGQLAGEEAANAGPVAKARSAGPPSRVAWSATPSTRMCS